jgi:hypothetical protein
LYRNFKVTPWRKARTPCALRPALCNSNSTSVRFKLSRFTPHVSRTSTQSRFD